RPIRLWQISAPKPGIQHENKKSIPRGFQRNWRRPIAWFEGFWHRPATEWRQENRPRREPWDGSRVGGKPRQGRQNRQPDGIFLSPLRGSVLSNRVSHG